MHFTYDNPNRTQLCQGDVIAKNDDVASILKEVHPHYYKKEDYSHFIVLTQSCDLYRRNSSPCSSRYIALAAVRPMTLVLSRLVQDLMSSRVERVLGFCSERRKGAAENFVERLLNNNADSYFFLYRQPDNGLHEDSCAFLHLSISVKAELHYETLLGAKILQLSQPFQHKLGFLVGKMYSRVGTEDWAPDTLTEDQFKERVTSLAECEGLVNWIPEKARDKIVKRLGSLPTEEWTEEKLNEILDTFESDLHELKEEHLADIRAVASEMNIESAVVDQLINRLRSRPGFLSRIR